MPYCIMRAEKKKSNRDVKMALEHNTRERQPNNADPERQANNEIFGGTVQESIIRHNERMPEKIRKNAVLAVELMMTASPDLSGNWNDYLLACDKWAMDTFGGQKNLLHIAHHFDEKTPHTHIVMTPLLDGKLNAAHYMGGVRHRMRDLQNDFYEKVGKPFGLDRGKPREETRAKHHHHKLFDIDQKERELMKKENELTGQEAELIKKLEDMEKYHKEQIELAKKRSAEMKIKEAEWEKRITAREAAVNTVLQNKGQADQIMVRLTEPLHGASAPVIKNYWSQFLKEYPAISQRILAQAEQHLKQDRPAVEYNLQNQNAKNNARSQ